MTLIEWTEQYAVGIPQIDQQHQHLFKLINKICAKQNPDVLPYDFIVYITYHFFTEERWMELVEFPGLQQHRAEHDEFSSRIQEIALDPQNPNNIFSLEFLLVLDQWLSYHILESDVEFGRFIASIKK